MILKTDKHSRLHVFFHTAANNHPTAVYDAAVYVFGGETDDILQPHSRKMHESSLSVRNMWIAKLMFKGNLHVEMYRKLFHNDKTAQQQKETKKKKKKKGS